MTLVLAAVTVWSILRSADTLFEKEERDHTRALEKEARDRALALESLALSVQAKYIHDLNVVEITWPPQYKLRQISVTPFDRDATGSTAFNINGKWDVPNVYVQSYGDMHGQYPRWFVRWVDEDDGCWVCLDGKITMKQESQDLHAEARRLDLKLRTGGVITPPEH